MKKAFQTRKCEDVLRRDMPAEVALDRSDSRFLASLGFRHSSLLLVAFTAAWSAYGSPGDVRWFFSTGAGILSSPALGPYGTIYCGSDDGNLYALSPDGSNRWVFGGGIIINSSPAVGADGTVYFGSVSS